MGARCIGEYLDLVVNGLDDRAIDALLRRELPSLADRLDVRAGRISTKLATCNEVFFTFDQVAGLYWFVQGHAGLVSYGPGHAYNATPEQLLMDRASLYLGSFHERTLKGRPRKRVTPEAAADIEHGTIWRKTRRVQSASGRWYYQAPPAVAGRPRGFLAPCPNKGGTFWACEVGAAWDYKENRGRAIYRCSPCGALFNLGERATPEYAALAAALGSPSASTDSLDGGLPVAAALPEDLEDAVLVYRVAHPRVSVVRTGIEYVSGVAPVRVVLADDLAAVRYLVGALADYRLPLTPQRALHDRDGWSLVPLSLLELEAFALAYQGAYELMHVSGELL